MCTVIHDAGSALDGSGEIRMVLGVTSITGEFPTSDPCELEASSYLYAPQRQSILRLLNFQQKVL